MGSRLDEEGAREGRDRALAEAAGVAERGLAVTECLFRSPSGPNAHLPANAHVVCGCTLRTG